MDVKYIDSVLFKMHSLGLLYKINDSEIKQSIYKITSYGLLVSQFTCLSNPIEHFDCSIIDPHMLSFTKNTAIVLMKEYNTRTTLIPIIISLIYNILTANEKLSLAYVEQLCDHYMVRLATLHAIFVRICYVSDFIYKIHTNTNIIVPLFYKDLMNHINTNYFNIHALL